MPFRFRLPVPRGLWPRPAAGHPTEPKELLWWRVSALFTDPDDTFYAGPSVEIAPLPTSTSVQAWDRLVSLADPENADETTWHEELDREVRLGTSQGQRPPHSVKDGSERSEQS